MKRHVLIYGLIGGTLVTLLKWTEYRFLVVQHSIEIYGGLTALTFAILGMARPKADIHAPKDRGERDQRDP